MAKAATIKGADEFFKSLYEALDRKTVNGKLAEMEERRPEITNALIGIAKAGMGPENVRFQSYSEAYRKWKQKHGGIVGKWMRSAERSGRAGGMLDPGNFSIEVQEDGRAFFTWTPGDAEQAIYGHVHNNGDGKMPKREWMNLQTDGSVRAVEEQYKLAMEEVLAEMERD